eukprot:TRINITY_DN17047_c0_g1_i1.p1 TRINITY_DN17047_c0_g1~~TRINITY_DN17047_c0_g1_i1.p1  ORF type:complete len:134 (-),score=20.34 TRINITY_DN17047_c0_g1_i1:117-518(-)
MYQKRLEATKNNQICFWDAEEHGLHGSTEYVEEFIEELQKEAVIYHNTDTGAGGLQFSNGGSPSIHEAFRNISKLIPFENGTFSPTENGTLYSHWRCRMVKVFLQRPKPYVLVKVRSSKEYVMVFGKMDLEFV